MRTIIQGDCLSELSKVASNSIDLICTDPPYGYSFMGKSWDKVAPASSIWSECLRVLKPGSFAFVMSAPRSDVLCTQISRLAAAGFRLDFTPIYWTYASGFPKAKKVPAHGDRASAYAGFHPKPAVEVVVVAMKPLEEDTVTRQVSRNGKGVTWLDDTRIPPGRFPANLLVSDDVLNDGRNHVGFVGQNRSATKLYTGNSLRNSSTQYRPGFYPGYEKNGSYSRFFDLDAWSATLPFLIASKANKKEKGASNTHPTVKPLRLMAYLVTLGSRAGDVVLDPFLGSGTTGIAALQLGRHFVGIERDPEYVEIARRRISAVSS